MKIEQLTGSPSGYCRASKDGCAAYVLPETLRKGGCTGLEENVTLATTQTSNENERWALSSTLKTTIVV